MARVILECPHFEWIPESELPENWETILNRSFSGMANFYHESILSDKAAKKAHHIVDEQIKGLIQSNNLTAILDVGVGDGSRLISIAPENAELSGIEINKIMAETSRPKGIDVEIHDFKKGLPFEDSSLDLVLFLSNDFGYITDKDPVKATSLRISALNEADRILKPGGFLYMELMSNDTEYQKDGLVCKYERVLKIDGKEKFRGVFYLKDFTFSELARLLNSSRFKGDSPNIQYMLLRDFENSEDLSDVGRIVKSFASFEGYSISEFQPKITNPITNKTEYITKYDYLILLQIQKGQLK